MRISIRKNTCDSAIGEATIDATGANITIDYDRDDLAHELVNAYRDLFDNADDWVAHLSMYMDSGEKAQLRPMLLDEDGNRSVFDDVDA
jgi:hypothetical protein